MAQPTMDSLQEYKNAHVIHTMFISVDKVDSLIPRYDGKSNTLNVNLMTSKEYEYKTKAQKVFLRGKRKDVHLAERKIIAWLSGHKALLVKHHLVHYILREVKDAAVDRKYYGSQGKAKLIWFKANTDAEEHRSMQLYTKCIEKYVKLHKLL